MRFMPTKCNERTFEKTAIAYCAERINLFVSSVITSRWSNLRTLFLNKQHVTNTDKTVFNLNVKIGNNLQVGMYCFRFCSHNQAVSSRPAELCDTLLA